MCVCVCLCPYIVRSGFLFIKTIYLFIYVFICLFIFLYVYIHELYTSVFCLCFSKDIRAGLEHYMCATAANCLLRMCMCDGARTC